MTFVPNFIFLFNYDIIITIILSLLFYYTLFVNHIEKPVCEFMIKVCMYVSCKEEAFCEPFIYLITLPAKLAEHHKHNSLRQLLWALLPSQP